MKRFFKEFFHIPKNGRVTEKAMLTRIILSVTMILTCMAAMSITAYAYFTCSVFSGVTKMQAAVWTIAVTAEADVAENSGVYAMDNSAGTEERVYQFKVAKDPTATASLGYAKIDIKTDVDNYGAQQTYYTQPIGKFLVGGNMTEDLDRDVKIKVPAGKVAYVQFTAELGSCAKQPVIEESTGILPQYAAGVAVTPETTEPETTEETTEPETTEKKTEPETTEEATETETTEEPTEPVTTEPETTEELTEAETTEPDTTEASVIQETTVPETTE